MEISEMAVTVELLAVRGGGILIKHSLITHILGQSI